jgi:hypothetical protein
MTFRLRTIEFTADGRRIVRDRDIDKPALTIGRSAENDVHLPDLAVEPRHAEITERGGGRLAVTATGSLGFGLDGKTVISAEVNPAVGAELRFGAYRIAVSRDADGAPLFTIEQSVEEGADAAQKAGYTLAGLLPGKRAMSWALVVLIVGIFLALPIASNLARPADRNAHVIGDASWTPGKLSLAHHALEQNCTACHVKPFQAVRDTACLSCHKDVHDHASPMRLAMARGEGPVGARLQWAVAHVFGKPGPGACVDCHVEHQGDRPMDPPRQQFCADCHGGLKDRLSNTTLGDAADFGTLHPQFTPAVVVDPFSGARRTVSLDAHPHEDNGLTFPHKLHLDPRGGVARMAMELGAGAGYGKPLDCANCHHATEDGVRFKPISMERDCESCHSLAYDRVNGIVRTLHHGDIPQMIADLSAARPDDPFVTARRRPGDAGSDRLYRFTPPHPAYNGMLISQALSKKGVCGECHTPVTRGGRLGVVPVRLEARYMAHGWFDHKAHSQEKCVSCHAARTSSSSSDVLLPGIGQCRTCHLGEASSKAKVPSSCVMCHSYHPANSPPAEDKLAQR